MDTMNEDIYFLETNLGKCNHTQETKNGTLTAINPYSGECLICGRSQQDISINE